MLVIKPQKGQGIVLGIAKVAARIITVDHQAVGQRLDVLKGIAHELIRDRVSCEHVE
jgi:hypothetical protein